jgi:hypothetical protein
MGSAVNAAIDGLAPERYATDAILSGALEAVTLTARAIPSVEEAERQLAARRERLQSLRDEGAPHGPVRTAECSVFGAESTVALAHLAESGELSRLVGEYGSSDVQCVRVGEACLAGTGGEMFVEYGLQMKARAAMKSFPVTLVNGNTRGYIVTREAFDAGGYEAANSLFSHESGPNLVSKVVELVARLA